MNLSYLKYAVEVEKTGSVTKAAQNFYMNQPHLSKIIRELERDLGCPIFDRTSKGMVPTKKGEEFLRYARTILVQEEHINALCARNEERALEISVCGPRAAHIGYAFNLFLKDLMPLPTMSARYMEANTRDTVRKVAAKEADLGIVRCQSLYESYCLKMLQDENLAYRQLWEFPACVIMGQKHPLACRDHLTYLDFADSIELVQGDIQKPSFTFESDEFSVTRVNSQKTVSVYDRGSQFELLRQLPSSYIWSSPVPYETLKLYGLVQRPCSYPGNLHRDFLIYRSGYRFSKPENEFIYRLMRIISQLSD
jgi:DNA-binding transcriptional LysR family regulator